MCRIAEVLIALQQVGNVKYTGWILQVPCSRNEEIISALQKQASTMEKELSEWKETVQLARQEFYELNYYTTVQLLTLRRELSVEGITSDIAPSVLFLLQSISSEVTSNRIHDVVNNVVTSASTSFNHEPAIHAEDGDSTSLQPSGASLVAAALPETSSDFQAVNNMPKLAENELTDDQQDILEFVTRALNCSKLLVLKAFEECQGREMDRYDYRDWCNDKLEEYKYEEESEVSSSEEGLDDDVMSISSSDSESASEHKFVYSPGMLFITTAVHLLACLCISGSHHQTKDSPMHVGSSFEIVTVESEMQEQVDEHHPVVQDLVSAGYTIEQSIDAVEKYETLDPAMEYLEQQVLEADDERDLIPSRPGYSQQASNDDDVFLDGSKMTW